VIHDLREIVSAKKAEFQQCPIQKCTITQDKAYYNNMTQNYKQKKQNNTNKTVFLKSLKF